MKLYLILILVAILLVSGCSQNTDKPADTTTPNQPTPSAKLTDLEARLVGTWSVGKSEFKADSGGLWNPDEPIDKIALKADKTWEDDKANKGTWSVETIEASDWEKWKTSWDTSSNKPDKKLVLRGKETVDGWIEKIGSGDYFWLFYRLEGDAEIPDGWIQLRFEKISDTAAVTPSAPSGPSTKSSDPEVAKTVDVPNLEGKLSGEWSFGTSRKLVLGDDGTWKLLPPIDVGGSGTWELKDVTRSDIDIWKEDSKISDASEIASKKIVFYGRVCSGGIPETEEVFIKIEDLGLSFTSCGIGWRNY